MDKLRVVIAGGTGLIGKQLSSHLISKGYEVKILSRQSGDGRIHWDPDQRVLDASQLEKVHAVINLSGANIAGWLWTSRRKRVLYSSRLNSTTVLVEAINKLHHPPKVLINASAIGYYPDLGDQWQDEAFAPDQDFMGHLCLAWEKALDPLRPEVRRVWLRTGLVLSRDGGILPRLRFSFMFKIGVYFGKGDMYYSWIHIEDICHMIEHLLRQDISGPVNAVAPEPVTMKSFMSALARMHRPAFLFGMPSGWLKWVLGDFAQVLLKGQRIRPEKILSSGFTFRYPTLISALAGLFQVPKSI